MCVFPGTCNFFKEFCYVVPKRSARCLCGASINLLEDFKLPKLILSIYDMNKCLQMLLHESILILNENIKEHIINSIKTFKICTFCQSLTS